MNMLGLSLDVADISILTGVPAPVSADEVQWADGTTVTSGDGTPVDWSS